MLRFASAHVTPLVQTFHRFARLTTSTFYGVLQMRSPQTALRFIW
jgi:hypothetical protein